MNCHQPAPLREDLGFLPLHKLLEAEYVVAVVCCSHLPLKQHCGFGLHELWTAVILFSSWLLIIMDSYQVWFWESVNNQTSFIFSFVYQLVSRRCCYTENVEQLGQHFAATCYHVPRMSAIQCFSRDVGKRLLKLVQCETIRVPVQWEEGKR